MRVNIRNRLAITVLLAVSLSTVGIWIGEDISEPIPIELILLLIGGCLSAFLVAPWRSAAGRSCTAAAISLVLLGSWYIGRNSANAAFRDCIERGDSVRASLAAYKRQNGSFPGKLDQLPRHRLPGGRILRENLLHYRRTKDGYVMSFSDWLVTFRATETEPFAATK